jgi:hypothetical protein
VLDLPTQSAADAQERAFSTGRVIFDLTGWNVAAAQIQRTIKRRTLLSTVIAAGAFGALLVTAPPGEADGPLYWLLSSLIPFASEQPRAARVAAPAGSISK